MTDLLLVGRWHGITRDQEETLRGQIDDDRTGRLVFVITGADQARTKRHPLALSERRAIVQAFAEKLGRPYEIHGVADTKDSDRWVDHVRETVRNASGEKTRLEPDETLLISSNPDVLSRFQAAGYRTRATTFRGAMPADLFTAIRLGQKWRELANEGTRQVYETLGLEKRIRDLFADVLLTEDGELSTGRDFRVYAAGMDASMGVKLADIAPHVRPGFIVDKGCGTGKLLVHLSELFPKSQIIGMDLSRELLRIAESGHYPNQNVSVVMGNIIHQHFPVGTVTTAIFSSVIHEIYSYSGYDRDQVRLALKNTHAELRPGGRVIIRDGVKPGPGRVWMRCDGETEGRFRRFARDFKGKSDTPGVDFTEQVRGEETWLVLGLHEANEFLSKKDYLENWAIEVNEEFGVFTLDEWRQELAAAGFRVVEARGYVNEWILTNRYREKVWLHADLGDRPGSELPCPDTTAFLVGEAAKGG